MPGQKISKLTVFYLAALLEGICLIMIPASSFVLKAAERNAITDGQYGLAFLPMVAVAIAVNLVFKKILFRLGPEKIFYWGLGLHGLYLLAVGATTFASGKNTASFLLLLAANGFLGGGFGFLFSILNILCVELFPQKRDPALAGLHASLGIGASVSPVLVNFFYEKGLWGHTPLFVFICFFVLWAICLGVRPARISASQTLKNEVFGEHRKSLGALPRRAKLFLVTVVVYGITESILGNWSAIYLSQDKGFSVRTASLALSTLWLFITIGRTLASIATLKIEARILYRLSPVLIVASLLAIIFTREESRIIFFYAGAGLGCSYFFPFSISLSTKYFDPWREKLASLAIAGLMLGVGIGSSVVGVLRDGKRMNLNQAFVLAMICGIIAGIHAFVLADGRKFRPA